MRIHGLEFSRSCWQNLKFSTPFQQDLEFSVIIPILCYFWVILSYETSAIISFMRFTKDDRCYPHPLDH